MTSAVFCIMPVRSLVDGKSRLSPVLNATERVHLNTFLFERMLGCLGEYPGLASTLIVSRSSEVLERARNRGAIIVLEPNGGGLNEAVGEATNIAIARGARGVFVLPFDLPLVTAVALRKLVAKATPTPVCLLVPDRRGVGTNFIYQSPVRLTTYAYGDGSFERHRVAAREAGMKVVVRREPSFAFDVDLPADYLHWRELTKEVPELAHLA
jgi:2-phospho-L-lactate/phosphoenolpyruvate guanylyltransferase